MDRFETCNEAFAHAVSRARDMCQLYSGLSHLRDDPNNDDVLRAACFQAVSSFDFYVHEVVATEASHRFRNSLPTRNIDIPMEIAMIYDSVERFDAVDVHVRVSHSYKTFVDPKKLSEILSCFCKNPWNLIVEKYNEMHGEGVDKSTLMDRLKSIWKRRNKIAHEADVNPTLSGISLWPIDLTDADITVTFIEKLGQCLPDVISQSLTTRTFPR